jgi:hypothetical protein
MGQLEVDAKARRFDRFSVVQEEFFLDRRSFGGSGGVQV